MTSGVTSAAAGVVPTSAGGATPPAVQQVLTARAGDYLCRFAADAGFRDCKDFRTEAANSAIANKAVLDEGDRVTVPQKQEKTTEAPDQTLVQCKRVNYRPATVRFLGQGVAMNQRGGPSLTRLGISNYITNKAGATGNGTTDPFYSGKGADTPEAMTDDERKTFADPDHFRVEVHDVVAAARGLDKVTVELQVLQPLYKRETSGTTTKIVRDLTSRPDPEAPAGFKIPSNAARKLVVECFQNASHKAFYRSRYLRLVTHPEDTIAGQTLFVGDYYDDGASEDEKRYTEILEQKVRARYTPQMCGEGKCRAEALADVGELRKEIRLVVHIMDDCCSYEDVRRVVYKQCRRTYAQAHLRPHLKEIVKHPPPRNILTIGATSGVGQPASGQTSGTPPRPSTIRIEVDGKTVEYRPAANERVNAVTDGIVAALRAQGFFMRVQVYRPNPPPAAPAQPSRDILVFRDAQFRQYAEITSVTCDDTRLSATFTPLTSAILGAFPQDDERREHRLLKACCETEWFDAIVIRSFAVEGGATLFGIATWVHLPFGPAFIVERARMTPAQDERYTFSHEMGHCLMHCGHCITAAEREQLMVMGGLAAGNAFDMPGRRRIMDAPLRIKYQVLNADGSFPGLKELGPGSAFGTAVSRALTFVGGNNVGAPTDRVPGPEW